MPHTPLPIQQLVPQMTDWRHRIHAWPELGFEEERTSSLVAERLHSLGLEVHEGIGGTGVVAIIDGKAPGESIGLRADMDALPLEEQTEIEYRSIRPGVAHSCGHDGHTAALLGTAHHLAVHRPARGRVVLIFQPAEEGGRGAIKMIEDGLFKRFPCDEVYAFHNMPLLGAGMASIRNGATLQSLAVFEIEVHGVGGHAAAPHKANDPLQVAARLATEISAIVGRYIDPMEPALVNVGTLQAGTTHNVIPSKAQLSGTVRALSKATHEQLVQRLQDLCKGLARISGCRIECTLPHSCPPCINASKPTELAVAACTDVLGPNKVHTDQPPFPFSDDFSYMLEQCPGAYLFLGQDSAMCHQPNFDFDDALLPVAASIFTGLISKRLG